MKKLFFSILVFVGLLLALESAARFFTHDFAYPDPLTGNSKNIQNFSILENLAKAETKKNGTCILITGGSVAYGWGASSPEMRFPSQLEVLLRKNGIGHETSVINAGVPDFEAVDELMLYLHHLRKFKPDLIIMFSGFNDVWAAARYQLIKDPTPQLARAFEHRVIAPADSAQLAMALAHSLATQANTFLRHWSRFYLWISENMQFIDYEPMKNLAKFDEKRGQESLGTFLDSVAAFHFVALRNHARFVLVLQPMRFLGHLPASEVPISRYESKLRTLHRNFLNPQLQALAASEKFSFYDLNDELVDELLKKHAFIDFCHLYDAGNRDVAEAVERIVRKELK